MSEKISLDSSGLVLKFQFYKILLPYEALFKSR